MTSSCNFPGIRWCRRLTVWQYNVLDTGSQRLDFYGGKSVRYILHALYGAGAYCLGTPVDQGP